MSEPADFDGLQGLCATVIPQLSGVVDGSLKLSADEQTHVSSCLRCQAELVRYRKLLRALHDLRTHVVHPAPGLLAQVLDRIGENGERRAVRSILTGRRAAYTGGIAVAAVAGVTGAILLGTRSRRSSKKAA